MSRRVLLGAVTVALGAALALTGCDGGDEPTTSPPTTSASPSPEDPTTDATSAAPTPPEVEAPTPAPEVTTDDHVGAIWAARYFLDLYTYMRQTGDTAQFEAMSAPDCQFCSSALENAVEIHVGGGWVEGGELVFNIDEARAVFPSDEDPNYVVRFTVTEEPSVVYAADGSSEALDGETLQSAVALQFVNGRFIVFGVNSE